MERHEHAAGDGGESVEVRGAIVAVALLLSCGAVWGQVNMPEPKTRPDTLDERLSKRYGDPLKFDGETKTWKEAAKTPSMVIGQATMWGALVLDLASTQHCVNARTCKEGNPIMGQSAGQRYAVGIGLTGLLDYLAVRQRQHGRGVLGFGVMYGAAAAHFLAFANNRQFGNSGRK